MNQKLAKYLELFPTVELILLAFSSLYKVESGFS